MPISTAGISGFRRMVRGFTLLELLVVLAIVSMILFLIPPFMPNITDGTLVKAAARELVSGLRMARTEAIAGQRETTLLLDVEEGHYTLQGRRRDLELPQKATLKLLGAASEMLSEQRGGIRFFPDGSSTGGNITVAYGDSRYTVSVHWLTGGVSIEP